MRFIRSSATTLLFKGSAMACGFAVSVLASRLLGPEGRGLFGIAMTVIILSTNFGLLGLAGANAFLLGNHKERARALGIQSLLVGLIGGGVAAAAIYFVDLAWPDFLGGLGGEMLFATLMLIPMSLLGTLFSFSFLGQGKIFAFNAFESGQKILYLAAGIAVLFILGLPLASYMMTIALALSVLTIIYVIWYFLSAPPGPIYSPGLFSSAIAYGIRAYVATVTTFAVMRIGILFVSHYLGTAEAGLYSNAQQFAELLVVIPSVIGTMLFSRVARGDKAELTARVARTSAAIFLPVFALMALFRADIFVLFFGAEFLPSSDVFLIFLPGTFLLGLEVIISSDIAGRGYPWLAALAWIPVLALNIAGYIFLIPRFGINGAAASTSLSFVVMFIFMVWYYRKISGLGPRAMFVIRRDDVLILLAFAKSMGVGKLLPGRLKDMNLMPYLIKIRLKIKELAKYARPATRVVPLEKFYRRHWHGQNPGADYLSCRTAPAFFFAPGDLDRHQRALENDLPASRRIISRGATNAVAHRFDLLGSGEVFLGDQIDWHIDFKSGKRWPLRHFSRTEIVNPNDTSDIKMPWELSRLQFLNDLGRAYILDGNPMYKREFMAILEDWEAQNPVDYGVNWACSMEIAIRAINIIWGLHYFKFDDNDLKFTQSRIRLLYYHALHIEKNLEITAAGANSNHLISDYLGLFYIGLLFPEFDRASRWLKMGQEGLEAEIRAQVNPDGADYECSTSYHRLVLEIFLSAFILGRLNKLTFSDEYKKRLYGMICFSEAMTPPSGLAPLMGDNDDGFIVRLSNNNPADHRPLVEIGLLLFGERIPLGLQLSEERLWYLGPDSLQAYHSPAPPRSRLFKDSGYAIIRGRDFHLAFNACGIPPRSFGGHKHNDLLSFTLELDGVPYLIDPGAYCYSANYRLRNLSRSTGLHNTVEIDGREQNRFFSNRLFYLMPDAAPRIHLWTDMGNSAMVSASHDGYARLDDRVIHRRTISASIETPSVLVTDEFTGKTGDIHTFAMRFITPLTGTKVIESGTVAISGDRSRTLVIKASPEGQINLDITSINYFPHYGRKAPGRLIEYIFQAVLPFKITSVMAPGGRHLPASDQIRVAEADLHRRFAGVGQGR